MKLAKFNRFQSLIESGNSLSEHSGKAFVDVSLGQLTS